MSLEYVDNTTIKLLDNKEENRDILLEFLLEIDGIFPIPLSEKIDLNEYVDRYLEFALILVAEINSKIIGINIFYANDFLNYTGHVTIIGILEKYRDRNLGTVLIQKSLEISKNKGIVKIFW